MPRFVMALAAVAFIGAAAGAQQPTFKGGKTAIVPVYVTVTDTEQRLVPGLEIGDFTILDNNKPAPILVFDNEPQPITVAVMLDTSGSMTGNLEVVKAAAEQFLMRLLPNDRATVGAFNDKIEFAIEITSDRDRLVRSLSDLDFGNPTRLYDAIDASLEKLRNVEGRRVVLVFTDGEDTASRLDAGDAIERARVQEVMIYSVGLENEYFNGQQRVRVSPDRGLRRVSEETGGGFFHLKKKDELGPTFTRIAQELHSQYIMGFSPETLDGKVHKLEVKIKRPGMTARARKSYVASAGNAGTGGK
jgi:Ca-activated chloride channel homolog